MTARLQKIAKRLGQSLFTKYLMNITKQTIFDHRRPFAGLMRAHVSDRRRKLGHILTLGLVVSMVLMSSSSWGADPSISTPFFSIGLDNAGQPGAPTVVLQIFLLMTVLSLAPAILIMVTSFTRIVIVLSLLRRALGTMQMPPNQVMIGLALFLTFFVMAPVWHKINQNALQPYLEKKIGHQQALQNAVTPLRDFMFKQTREKDLALFVDIAKLERPKTVADIPSSVLIPSFIISEVKTAFQMFTAVCAVFDHRHGGGQCSAFNGHDDAAAYYGFVAV